MELRVPEEYPTLAAAYQAAPAAACIVLGAGSFDVSDIKVEKTLQVCGQGKSSTTIQGRIVVRGHQVGLVVNQLTAVAGGFWVYGGAAVTISECTLQAGVLIGSTYRGEHDNTRNKVAPQADDSNTEALISNCVLETCSQDGYGASVHNGAKLMIEKCHICGDAHRGVEVGDRGTTAVVNDCTFESSAPCTPNPFAQWGTAVGAAVSLGGELSLKNCELRNYGSAAITGCDEASLKIEKCQMENNYRGVWAWSGCFLWIKQLKYEGSISQDMITNESVNFTDATPRRELHVPNKYSSIESAYDNANAGDKIVLHPGTYRAVNNRLVIRKSLEIEGCGEDSNNVILERSEVVVTGKEAHGVKLANLTMSHSPENAVTVLAGGHVTVEDCEFLSHEGSVVDVTGARSCAVLRHSVFHGGESHGVICQDTGSAFITGCEFEGLERHAIKVSDIGTKLSIQMSVIRYSADCGVDVGDGASITIRSCDVLQNGGDGVSVHGEDANCVVLESKVMSNNARGIFGWRGATVTLLGTTVAHNTLTDIEVEEGCKYNGQAHTPVPVVQEATGSLVPTLPPIRPVVPEHRRPSVCRPNHGQSAWKYIENRHADSMEGDPSQTAENPLSPTMDTTVVCAKVSGLDNVPEDYATEVQIGGVQEFIGRYQTDEQAQKARYEWKNQHRWSSDSHSAWRKLSSLSGWMPPVGYRSTLQRDLDKHKREQDRWIAQKNSKDRGGANSYFPEIGLQK